MRVRLAGAVCTVGLLLAACSTEPEENGQGGADSTQTRQLEGSAVRGYESIAEVLAETEAIVVGTAGESRVETIGPVPFTVTEVKVDDRVSGPSSETVLVRQTGDESTFLSSGTPLLVSGNRYALFLEPFYFEPGKDTGQQVIVGWGAWEENDGEFRLHMLEPDQVPVKGLPATLTDDSLNTLRSP